MQVRDGVAQATGQFGERCFIADIHIQALEALAMYLGQCHEAWGLPGVARNRPDSRHICAGQQLFGYGQADATAGAADECFGWLGEALPEIQIAVLLLGWGDKACALPA
jgi:hypothetical protein